MNWLRTWMQKGNGKKKKESIKSGESLPKVNHECRSNFSTKCRKPGWSSCQLVLRSSLWNSAVSRPFCAHAHWQSEQIVLLYAVLLLISTFADGRLESTRGGWGEQVTTFHTLPSPPPWCVASSAACMKQKVGRRVSSSRHNYGVADAHRMWDERAVLKEISADTSARSDHTAPARACGRPFVACTTQSGRGKTGKGMTPGTLWWIKTKLIS